ncbi:MAG: hypothetical protein WC003_17495, partial [Terrimicrobiaceae bacterium]
PVNSVNPVKNLFSGLRVSTKFNSRKEAQKIGSRRLSETPDAFVWIVWTTVIPLVRHEDCHDKDTGIHE